MKKTRVREIGGEFSLPTEYLRKKATNQFARYFRYPRKIFLSSGRGALRLVAKALRLGEKDEVLLPSYLCKEILTPFREEHARLRFYKVDKKLNVDIGDVEEKIGQNTKALLFIHYFGFPQPSTQKIKSVCADNDVFLIEDLVQSFLSTHQGKVLGSAGDVTISSYRKWIPIPDGALLGINDRSFRTPPIKKMSRNAAIHVMHRLVGLELKDVYLKQTTFSKGSIRRVFYAADELLDTTPVEISDYSKKRLSKFDFNAIIKKRRTNFQRLLGRLARLKMVEPIYKKLPAGACPLGSRY